MGGSGADYHSECARQPHVLVSGINQPINAAAADVDGDGIPEIALAHEFSNVYARSAGIVSVLTHQGDPAGPWSIKEIDRVPTSHRLRFADIDASGRKVLVNFPLMGAQAVAPDYRDHADHFPIGARPSRAGVTASSPPWARGELQAERQTARVEARGHDHCGNADHVDPARRRMRAFADAAILRHRLVGRRL